MKLKYVLCLFTISLLLSVNTVTADGIQPLSVYPENLDFGTVQSGGKYKESYTVKNNTNDVINIYRISTGTCAGVLAAPFRASVSPNEEYKLSLTYRPDKNMIGDSEFNVTLMVDSLEQKTIHLKAKGFVINPEEENDSLKTLESGGDLLNISETDYIENPIYLAIYTKPGCIECLKEERIISEFLKKKQNIVLKVFNANSIEDIESVLKMETAYDVKSNYKLTVPSVFIGGDYLIRNDININRLEEIVRNETNSKLYNKPWESLEDLNIKNQMEETFSKFTYLPVIGAGLFDGINPCAFAVLIFFLSYLKIAKRSKQQIIYIGTAFTLSVFSTYFLIGFGFFQGLRFLVGNTSVALVVYTVSGILAILFAILSFCDALKIKKGSADLITLQLSQKTKDRTRSIIRNNSRNSLLLISTVITGVIVSLLELGCTGQIYVPVISYIIQQTDVAFKAVMLLLLYNIAFILPLILIFVLFILGTTHEKLTKWFQNHLILIKLILCVVFLILGISILVKMI